MGRNHNRLARKLGVQPETLDLAIELHQDLRRRQVDASNLAAENEALRASRSTPSILRIATRAYLDVNQDPQYVTMTEEEKQQALEKAAAKHAAQRHERMLRLRDTQETSRTYNSLDVGQLEDGDDVVFDLVQSPELGSIFFSDDNSYPGIQVKGRIMRGDAIDDKTFICVSSDSMGHYPSGSIYYLQGSGSRRQKDELDQWAIDEPGVIRPGFLLGFGYPGEDAGHWVKGKSHLAVVKQMTVNDVPMFVDYMQPRGED